MWDYIVTCQQDQASGERIWWLNETSLRIQSGIVAEAAFWDHETPAVEMGKVSTLITYTGDTHGDPAIHKHIYGSIWVPSGIFLPVTRR